MRAENRKDAGWPRKDRLGTKSGAGARSAVSLQRMEKGGAGSLLAKVLGRDNLNRAFKRARRNKGAPGIDGMTVDEALPYLSAAAK